MRTQESQILAKKIIDASEGYLIIPNWDAEDYKDNVSGLLDDILDLLCRDFLNNNARNSDEKVEMLSGYTDIINNVLKEFEKEHKIDIEPFKRQLQEKSNSFAFEVRDEK